jgi:hypothetical protein
VLHKRVAAAAVPGAPQVLNRHATVCDLRFAQVGDAAEPGEAKGDIFRRTLLSGE